MKQKVLEDIIRYYKTNYENIKKQELYKWKAVKHFQEHWDVNSNDFYLMLKESLSKTQNLMSSGQYFPRTMILWIAEKEPETARKLFLDLFNLEEDLIERISSFQGNADSVIQRNYDGTANKSYQDHRAIMVYLSLMYPDKYFLYKYIMFKNFTELIDYSNKPKRGNIENVFYFEGLCKSILGMIENDKEIMQMYSERYNEYYDPEYHLLAQDIVYSGQYYSRISILDGDSYERIDTNSINSLPITFKKFIGVAIRKEHILTANKVDHIEKQRKNTKLGELGESFVFQYENEKVNKMKSSKNKEVIWKSNVEGDGLGYDILSYDEQGNEIYIEVKTTTGNELSSFFITRNELKKSIEVGDNYYLYRVYNFNSKSLRGDISILRGSLEEICITPQIYKVELEKKV